MEMSDLPDGWRSCALADVTLPYKTCDPLKQPEASFTYIDLSSVDNELGRIVSPKILQGKDAPSRARKVVKAGDVIFATTRPYLKGIALVPAEYDGQVCSTGFSVLRARPDVLLPQWLYYACRSDLVLDQVLPHMRGASYPAVTDKDVLAATIPLPLLAEQRRIVARIEELADKVERARGLRREAMQDLDAVVLSALAQAVEGILIDGLLGDVLLEKPKNGWSPRCDNSPTGTPVLTLSAVTGFQYRGDKFKTTSEPVSLQADYWLHEGDLLITRSNTAELVGHAAIYNGSPSPCIYPDLMMRLKVDEKQADKQFVHLWLMSDLVRDYIRHSAIGTSPSMKKIVQGTVAAIPFPVRLSLAEQYQVARYVRNIQTKIDALEKAQAGSAIELDALLPSLLTRAFRGEL